jgi:hypothetical protein
MKLLIPLKRAICPEWYPGLFYCLVNALVTQRNSMLYHALFSRGFAGLRSN